MKKPHYSAALRSVSSSDLHKHTLTTATTTKDDENRNNPTNKPTGKPAISANQIVMASQDRQQQYLQLQQQQLQQQYHYQQQQQYQQYQQPQPQPQPQLRRSKSKRTMSTKASELASIHRTVHKQVRRFEDETNLYNHTVEYDSLHGAIRLQPPCADEETLSTSISSESTMSTACTIPATPVITDTQAYRLDEIRVGRLLGEGGFNDVREVQILTRSGFAGSEQSGTTGLQNSGVAIKHLNRKVRKDFRSFRCGAVDLAMEAKLLAALSHKNIIGLHGTSHGFSSSPYASAPADGNYFLILDKLYGTVEDRLELWRSQRDENNNNNNNMDSSFRKISPFDIMGRRQAGALEKAAVLNRLQLIGQPVAEAMRYLHSKHIIYRDLKPQNIGFGRDGTVQLFDFGLAREVTDPDKFLTASTGSRRYMAPEVALGQFYDYSADVYSYGIFLWEVLTLEKPFENMSRVEHEMNVIQGGHRPKLGRNCGLGKIQRLLAKCWGTNCDKRPTFRELVPMVQTMLNKQRKNVPTRRSKSGRSFMLRCPLDRSSASLSDRSSSDVGSVTSAFEDEMPRKSSFGNNTKNCGAAIAGTDQPSEKRLGPDFNVQASNNARAA